MKLPLLFFTILLLNLSAGAQKSSDTTRKAVTLLGEVIISSRKPLVEVKPGKIVFNVEGSINATGNDAIELLRKSPGVVVDKDDNILLSGKSGARIYIDGKPSPLAGADLAAYLRSLSSNDIEAIEIITVPSARFEAEGNAGIINIRLKKNKSYGWNGSVGSGYGIGLYSRYNGTGSINFRNSRINFFNNLSAYNNRQQSRLNLYRLQNDTTYDQQTTTTTKTNGYTLKTGLDLFINKKTTLGAVVNGSFSDGSSRLNSQTPIAASGKAINSRLDAADNASDNRKNLSANVNYRYTDSSGLLLSMDADYGFYRLHRENVVSNLYTYTNGSTPRPIQFSNITPTDIDLISLKADLEKPFQKGRLQAGFKISQVKTTNELRFYQYQMPGQPVYDTSRSNRFGYREWINAVYAQYDRQFTRWSYQLGIRAEQTVSRGELDAVTAINDKIVKRNYTGVFPSASVTWRLNTNNTLSFSYNRRIDRPRYQDLNPFENKLDELSYQKGNPFLRPQYTHNFEIRNVYRNKLTTTLSYSRIRDFFAQLTDTIESKRSFLMQRNLDRQQVYSFNVNYLFGITAWWSAYLTLNLYHTRYRADFEENKQIRLQATVTSVYQQQSITLGKGWSAELSGFFNSPSIWGGTYKTRSLWSADIGLQKKLWNDNATLKATVNDVFFSLPWRGTSSFGGLYVVASGQWESRQLKINFNWRFGNKQVKTAARRKTGLDDLKERAD